MCPQVIFHPKGRAVDVPEGTNLLEAAILAGVEVNSACAGRGVCGRCRVVVEGSVDSAQTDKVTKEEWDTGYRLACTSKVTDADCSVFVPAESQLQPMQIVGGKVNETIKDLAPLVQARNVFLRAPSLQDNDGDLERLEKQLGFEPGALECPLPVLRKLSTMIKEKKDDVMVLLADGRIIDIRPGDSLHCYGAAIDIGTTTVAMELVDLRTGETVAHVSDYNKQLMHGEDVLSRIMHAEDHGLSGLTHLIVDTINHMLARISVLGDDCVARPRRICACEISAVSIGCNTVMAHMFLGLDPTRIRYSPYIAVTNLPPLTVARAIGIKVNPRAPVYLVPGRASWVGGDVVADIVASGLAEREETSILIDVGTNGEVVLGNKDWLLACSASAGPAFEGGEVRHGMRAGDGAIEKVSLRNGVEYQTIGNVRPKGICGSGLIDLLAQLFVTGVLDKKGHLQGSDRVRDGEGGREYVLVYSKDAEKDGYDLRATGMTCCPMDKVERQRDITVTETDITNIIRTKAALFAAAEVLLDTADMTYEDVDRVFIAGGFGHHIDLDNAVAIGLLPDLPRERFTFIGNGSLEGARQCLLSQAKRDEAMRVHRSMTYVELSTDQRFFDRFSSASFLPHTDLGRFPSLK